MNTMGLAGRKRSRIPLVVWLLIPAAVLLFAGRERAPGLRGVLIPAGMRRPPEGAGTRKRAVQGGEFRLLKRPPGRSRGRQMSEADKRYGLLSELSGIEETRNPERQRHLPVRSGVRLARGRLARPHDKAGPQPGLWTSGFRRFGCP